MDKEKQKIVMLFGVFIALGVGIGTAVGAAIGNVGAGLAIGVAIGVAVGAGSLFVQLNEVKKDGSEGPDNPE